GRQARLPGLQRGARWTAGCSCGISMGEGLVSVCLDGWGEHKAVCELLGEQRHGFRPDENRHDTARAGHVRQMKYVFQARMDIPSEPSCPSAGDQLLGWCAMGDMA